MAIQPIDLQTMYSQLANVSQNVSNQQSAVQMSQAVQLQNQKLDNLENSKKVQGMGDEKSQSNTVNEDGHNSDPKQNFQQNLYQKEAGKEIQPDNSIKADDNSTLGRIVDIIR